MGELIIFSALFGVVAYQHLRHPAAFKDGQDQLNQAIGLTITVILLVGSVLVALAQTAMRAGARDKAIGLLQLTAVCGVAFIGFKVFEYTHLMRDGLRVDSNDFWTSYFVITGAHMMHVLVGLIVVISMWMTLRRHAPHEGRTGTLLECGGLYWHMVDLIWLVLYPLFYLVN